MKSLNSSISSFEGLDTEDIDIHCRIAKYGHFILSDGIRPSYDVSIPPIEGYRQYPYKKGRNNCKIWIASVSREKIFNLFLDMLDVLKQFGTVNIIVSTVNRDKITSNFRRTSIDIPILKGVIYNYENLIVNDGNLMVSVYVFGESPLEFRLDDHKLFFVYGNGELFSQYEKVFKAAGLCVNNELQFLSEGEHIHLTNTNFFEQKENFAQELNAETRRVFNPNKD